MGTDLDYIASISEADAAKYGEAVLASGKTSGYYGDYRYLLVQQSDGFMIYFLNAGSEQQFARMILYISIAVALFAFFAVFLLIFIFSKQAISPFVRNMEKQKQFITDASHEIKTPLTSISTSADILAMELPQNEWVENIHKQSLRLSRLVENLTALSRMDEENPLPDHTDFSVSELAWEAAEPFAPRILAAGKHYEQHIAEDLVYHGDYNAIHQMISLLLDNAVKYSDAGGSIRLDVHKKRRDIVIEVYNTCDHVNTKDLDRLFERFYRSDASRSRETGGAGVGLSIAKAITEAHRGKIYATSPDGKSLCVRAVL